MRHNRSGYCINITPPSSSPSFSGIILIKSGWIWRHGRGDNCINVTLLPSSESIWRGMTNQKHVLAMSLKLYFFLHEFFLISKQLWQIKTCTWYVLVGSQIRSCLQWSLSPPCSLGILRGMSDQNMRLQYSWLRYGGNTHTTQSRVDGKNWLGWIPISSYSSSVAKYLCFYWCHSDGPMPRPYQSQYNSDSRDRWGSSYIFMR